METTRTTFALPSAYAMDLAVALEDGAIRVEGGVVTLEGRTDEIADESIAVSSRAHPTVIFCYLAREVATDKLVLFVDEHVQDGVDEAYTFERDGPYRLLAYLFRVTVPPNTTDLRGLDFDRWRIVAEE